MKIKPIVLPSLICIIPLLFCFCKKDEPLDGIEETDNSFKMISNTNGRIHAENGTLTTNYMDGQGFVYGGINPAPLESPSNTDVSQLMFANPKTDPFTFDVNSSQLSQTLGYAEQYLDPSIELRFYLPTGQPQERLQENINAVQSIVNQHYTYQNHDLLATWILPPNWDSENEHVVMIYNPGFQHSNNSKLFGEPFGFFQSYMRALQISTSKNIILLHLNCGGRTASGLQLGWENNVNQALEWGETHLGVDRHKILVSGASRGGYSSCVLSARLQEFPENQVRGIFSSVFGTATLDYQHYELVPSDLNSKFTFGLAEWRRKAVFSASLEEIEIHGPLGALSSLVTHTDKPEVQIYCAFGSADPTMLPSSAYKLYQQVENATTVHPLFDLFLGKGHDAGDDQRNVYVGNMAAALSDNSAWQFQNGYNTWSNAGNIINQNNQQTLHLRVANRLAFSIQGGESNRTATIEVVGEIGANFEVVIRNSSNQTIEQWNSSIGSEGYNWLDFNIPSQNGFYEVELISNASSIGKTTFEVLIDVAISELSNRSDWRPDIMPVIF